MAGQPFHLLKEAAQSAAKAFSCRAVRAHSSLADCGGEGKESCRKIAVVMQYWIPQSLFGSVRSSSKHDPQILMR
jgi:hypothetical protein